MKNAILFFLLIFCQKVFSQEDSSITTLDEVIVTTQRIEQPVSSIPFAVSKLGKEYFERIAPRTLPEAFQGTNGIFVQKTTHGGGSVFLRGLTGNQTLILIDGIRLNNSTFRYGPNQYLNTIDAYSVQSVEFDKGTGSVQYGSDAMGGVVRVVTQEPIFSLDNKRTWRAKLLSKYMTGDMEKTGRGEISYSGKKFAIAGGVTIRNFGDLIGGDTTGKQSSSGYGEWAMNLKAKFRINEKMALTIAQQQLSQRNVPVFYRIALENFAVNEFDKQQRQLQFFRLDVKGNRSLIDVIKIIGSRQQNREVRKSRKVGSVILREEEDQVTTFGLTADVLSVFAKDWQANSGIEFYSDGVESGRIDINQQTGAQNKIRGLYADDARYQNASLFSLHQLQHGRWVADVGLRFNAFSIRLQDTASGNIRLTPSALVWNAGLSFELHKHHYLYASYSTGYRAPNVDDLSSLGVVDFRYEVPTFWLRPEHSGSLELGYKMKSKKWKGDVTFFSMRLKDLITRIKVDGEVVNGYAVYRKENSERALVQGIEAALTWYPLSCINLNGSITYTHGNNQTKNEPLRRIPPTNGRFMLNLQKEDWSASAEWLWAAKQNRLAKGDKEDIRINPLGTPGWQVLNLYWSWHFRAFDLTGGLQNLFNRDYRTHGSGINGVGRSGWLSVGFSL
jgi:hemoglobin/transferrin/lactoferrin receptor protein